MMKYQKIYELHNSSKGHPYVLTSSEPAGYFYELFDGKPLPKSWRPYPFTIERKTGKLADVISWKDPFPLFSEKAVELFRKIAPDAAEYIFFTEIKNKPYYVINVLVSEDILDEERSDATRHNGMIVNIKRHVFKQEKLSKLSPIFKLPGRFDSTIFATEEIPEMVVREKLTGFEFRDPSVNHTRDLFLGKDVNAYPGVIP